MERKVRKMGNIILVRPDPQIIWKDKSFPKNGIHIMQNIIEVKTGGGSWEYRTKLPEVWQIKYKRINIQYKAYGI